MEVFSTVINQFRKRIISIYGNEIEGSVGSGLGHGDDYSYF